MCDRSYYVYPELSLMMPTVSCAIKKQIMATLRGYVPDSALILRKHGLGNNLFSCLLFNELEGFNPRDQLGFAFVRDKMNPRLKLNLFEVEVLEKIAVEYRHNLKKFGDIMVGPVGPKRAKRPSQGHLFLNESRCQNYLLTMWG
ncbi:hypothetical protein V6N11_063889 [Hibiscus sabdariffa]|uniref:TOD1/MUCI70 glycosyltransferase-like domain-containing protein n=1 Tax=Hibiscus sabdariffa TaxID=183260 RepID=A0ABR2PM02_9ROSI